MSLSSSSRSAAESDDELHIAVIDSSTAIPVKKLEEDHAEPPFNLIFTQASSSNNFPSF